MESTELMHYGVKGMKWGVRKKYYNSDGSLNDRGVEKYAKKGYARDVARSSKTVVGKALAAYTGSHDVRASAKYASSSKEQNQARAEKYVKEKNKTKRLTRERAAKIAAKGAEVTSKILLASAADDIFYGGAGKEAIKQTGRAAITAIVMARGGYDIKWFDKQGRRVG